MRVVHKGFPPIAIGVSGTIVSHENNLVNIRLDDGMTLYSELYWNLIPLDKEAEEYLKMVAKTATPMVSSLMDGNK